MLFHQLDIGQQFDFISPISGMNSFYLRCVKISARKYQDSTGVVHTIGSRNAAVFHVSNGPLQRDPYAVEYAQIQTEDIPMSQTTVIEEGVSHITGLRITLEHWSPGWRIAGSVAVVWPESWSVRWHDEKMNTSGGRVFCAENEARDLWANWKAKS